jgi:hypothetical protein
MTRTGSLLVAMRLIALPTTIVLGVTKAVWSARNALRSHFKCRHCQTPIALVRAWRCSCGFTYVGHLLRRCDLCGSRPLVVRCGKCALTWRIR